MTTQLWLLYLTTVMAVIFVPGPSAALCLTHGAKHGRWRTTGTIVGGMCASLTLMALSALGLGAVIASSELLFQIIKFAGAAYLIAIGISTWRSSSVMLIPSETELAEPRASRESWSRLFRHGFFVGIGNPKDLLFFGALFPQFIDPGRSLVGQLSVLAATWLVVDGVAMFGYAASGGLLRPLLVNAGLSKWFNRVAGGIFVSAGAALMTARR
ncbi:MAG TPA: LysE family translocator [Paucimonas sp.]|nr:LysE family translocator [Paucimonas sp.]